VGFITILAQLKGTNICKKKQLKGTDMFGFVGNLDHNGMTTELSISRQRSFRDLVGRLVREGADLFFLLASL
jgi:hypothetical protein